MTIARLGLVIGVLTVFLGLAALAPLVGWTWECNHQDLSKDFGQPVLIEHCSPAGKAKATGRRHVRHALRHPLDSARFTVTMLLFR